MLRDGNPLTLHEIFGMMDKNVLRVYLKRIAEEQNRFERFSPSGSITIENAISFLQESDPLSRINRSVFYEHCNQFISILTGSGYTLSRKSLETAFTREQIEKVLEILEPSLLVFRLSGDDGKHYICLPIDYLFTNRFHLQPGYRTSLGRVLRYYNKNMILPMMLSLGIGEVTGETAYTMKADILGHVIRERGNTLSSLEPDEQKIMAFLRNLSGIASTLEMADFLKSEFGITDSIRQNESKELLFSDSGGKRSILSSMVRMGLVAIVTDRDSRLTKGFMIPSEYFETMLEDELAAGKKQDEAVVFAITGLKESTILLRMKAFMYVTAHFTMLSKRKNMNKLESLLGVSEEQEKELLSIARYSNLVAGSPTTFSPNENGMVALSSHENMLGSIIKYVKHIAGMEGYLYSYERTISHLIAEYFIAFFSSSDSPILAARLVSQTQSEMAINEACRELYMEELSSYTTSQEKAFPNYRQQISGEFSENTILKVLNRLKFLGIISSSDSEIIPSSVIIAGPLIPALNDDSAHPADTVKKLLNPDKVIQVKPDFEIIATLNIDWEKLRYLLGATELVSADHVFVCRITEGSLRRFSNHSGDLEKFLATLKENSSTGVPKNVEQLFHDTMKRRDELRFTKCSAVLAAKDRFILDSLKRDPSLKNVTFLDLNESSVALIDAQDVKKVLGVLHKKNYFFISNADEADEDE